ncbi:unnamed protein product [Gongylonema pulchrum]|uniref:Uncharacterized protein n=1 Tax=Gongylonema pulchrum TaxID=637853 RepID=A0A183D7I5_9BILA|nr:unnamed protein product [Gongylonema pulchrum]
MQNSASSPSVPFEGAWIMEECEPTSIDSSTGIQTLLEAVSPTAVQRFPSSSDVPAEYSVSLFGTAP